MPLTKEFAEILKGNFITIYDVANSLKQIYSSGKDDNFFKWIKLNPDFIILHIYGNNYDYAHLHLYVYKKGTLKWTI